VRRDGKRATDAGRGTAFGRPTTLVGSEAEVFGSLKNCPATVTSNSSIVVPCFHCAFPGSVFFITLPSLLFFLSLPFLLPLPLPLLLLLLSSPLPIFLSSFSSLSLSLSLSYTSKYSLFHLYSSSILLRPPCLVVPLPRLPSAAFSLHVSLSARARRPLSIRRQTLLYRSTGTEYSVSVGPTDQLGFPS
jgi:hypothetical protein